MGRALVAGTRSSYNLIAGIQEKCKAARIAIHRLKVNNAAVTPKHSVVLTLDRKLGVSGDMTRFAHSHRGSVGSSQVPFRKKIGDFSLVPEKRVVMNISRCIHKTDNLPAIVQEVRAALGSAEVARI